MQIKRYLHDPVEQDLAQKMVFLAGPRQVGKTTLAKEIMAESGNGLYYLWDSKEDRQALMKPRWPAEPSTVVLDELHKYRRWKQWIKGEYDKHKEHIRFIVTGSARMDIYRKGGDSLQGRYHHWRLHPFSVNELEGVTPQVSPAAPLTFSSKRKEDQLAALFRFGGFPEPIVAQSEKTHRRWEKERLERFFREDLRDLENVRDISSLQILSDMLPSRVGSPLSLNSLREDLEVSHKAVTHWMEVFERLYFLFRLRPYTTSAIRGLKKEAKAYLWDWSLVKDKGPRFENMIASHLLKFCHYLEDSEGYKMDLYYMRDVAKREVDFLVTIDRKPWFAVEAKVASDTISPDLKYFGDRLKIPYLFQVTFDGGREFVENGVHLLPAAKFLTALV
ncbi:MAG: ATP-binding protein [Pseudomonadota bacterium]